MPRSLVLALAPWLAAGCFTDTPPRLTDPLPGTTAAADTTADPDTSTGSTSTVTSTTDDPVVTTGDPPATTGTGDACPFGQDAVFYEDGDGDGFGAGEPIASPCVQPPDTALKPGDCNDGVPAINPDATELCNGVDDDCDALQDEHSPQNTSCSGCALGTFADRPYWACRDSQTRTNAEILCQLRGPDVHLAVADEIQEHAFLLDLALATFPDPPEEIGFYLGLTRAPRLASDCMQYSEAEAWRTILGTPPTFLAWRINEPSNTGCDPDCMPADIDDPACMRENCVEMATPDTGAYNDRFCGFVLGGYFCEQLPSP